MCAHARHNDRLHVIQYIRVFNWFGRVRSAAAHHSNGWHNTYILIYAYIYLWISKPLPPPPPPRDVHGKHEWAKPFNWCHQKLIYSIEPYLASVMLTFVVYFSHTHFFSQCVFIFVFLCLIFNSLNFFFCTNNNEYLPCIRLYSSLTFKKKEKFFEMMRK